MREQIRGHEGTIASVWIPVCLVASLEPFWGEAVLVGAQQFALFLFPDGDLHAVSNGDPATGACVMSRGIVGSKGARRTIASPLHKEVYDLATGECLSGADYFLPVVPVRIVDGTVELHLEVPLTLEAGAG